MKGKWIFIIFLIAALVIIGAVLTAQDRQLDNGLITAEEVAEMLSTRTADSDIVILDVRTPEEFAQGHIPGAVNINFLDSAFKDQIQTLSREKHYILVCRSGNRSGKAMAIMQQYGFTWLRNMTGGMLAWRQKQFSEEK